MPKTKPNEKCPCNSGIKYKKCCSKKDALAKQQATERFETSLRVLEGKPIESERLSRINTYFLERYHIPSIDMSDTITIGNFTSIHSRYSGRNVFLLLERNENNASVFERKDAADCDILISYKRYYQAFKYESEYDDAMKEIHKWIRKG